MGREVAWVWPDAFGSGRVGSPVARGWVRYRWQGSFRMQSRRVRGAGAGRGAVGVRSGSGRRVAVGIPAALLGSHTRYTRLDKR